MANVYRQFADSIERLEAFGNSYPTYNQAQHIVEAHKALIAVIEREQLERRRLRLFVRTPRPGNASSMSDWVLDAHRGWAGRVIDTAKNLNDDDQFSQVSDAMRALLVRARDEIIQNKHRFRDPKDGLFGRIYDHFRRKFKNWMPKLHRIRKNPYTQESEAYLSLREQHDKETAAIKANLLSEIAASKGPPLGSTATGAKLLRPVEAGLSGIPLNVGMTDTVEEGECYNKICIKGWVYGERWGSEDYPCPNCNSEKYEAWRVENHPNEIPATKKEADARVLV